MRWSMQFASTSISLRGAPASTIPVTIAIIVEVTPLMECQAPMLTSITVPVLTEHVWILTCVKSVDTSLEYRTRGNKCRTTGTQKITVGIETNIIEDTSTVTLVHYVRRWTKRWLYSHLMIRCKHPFLVHVFFSFITAASSLVAMLSFRVVSPTIYRKRSTSIFLSMLCPSSSSNFL